MADLDEVIRDALDARELSYERTRPGAFLVKLEGQHKLATMTWLVVGDHSMLVEAFFIRQPDENKEAFYRFLLERNARMYGVTYSVDHLGDVYLVGHVPLHAVTDAEIDRLLGCVLTYSDGTFDRALEIGFAGSIRREWQWRQARGLDTRNLQAFARFAEPESAS